MLIFEQISSEQGVRPVFINSLISYIFVAFCSAAFPKTLTRNAFCRDFARVYPSQFLKSWYVFMFQLPCLAEFYMRMNDYKMLKSMFGGRTFGIRSEERRLTEEELDIYKYSSGKNITHAINYYRAGEWGLTSSKQISSWILARRNRISQHKNEQDALLCTACLLLWAAAAYSLRACYCFLGNNAVNSKTTTRWLQV